MYKYNRPGSELVSRIHPNIIVYTGVVDILKQHTQSPSIAYKLPWESGGTSNAWAMYKAVEVATHYFLS